MKKRGDSKVWPFLTVFLILVMGALILFISSKMFYSKSEIYSKQQVNDLVESKSMCKYIHFTDTKYFGQTPWSICAAMNTKPEFLFIREVTSVLSDSREIYVDENYYVDNTLFDIPLGMAVDGERRYGHPLSMNVGKTNRFTQGLLCC